MIYKMARAGLFRLEAERAHEWSLRALDALELLGVLKLMMPKLATTPVHVMGLRFPNAVGLAAGLDKNADHLEALSRIGFGFLEVGTVTPRPQAGNPKPRLFRLPQAQGIINRMGFNNKGVQHLVEQVRISPLKHTLLGINIGKNADTPVEQAAEDYLAGLRHVYAYADYVTVNISSPNTPGLRSLQFGAALSQLLETLKHAQQELAQLHQRYVPMAVKVAPDLNDADIQSLADTFAQFEVDAVIATNTTLARDAVQGLANAEQAGGLSGRPLWSASTAVLSKFRQALPAEMPIIAAGGILSAEDGLAKLEAGASLVQIYTGLIYQGPGLVHDLIRAFERRNR